MAVELAPWDPEVDVKAEEIFDRTERIIAELIRKGQENGEFATSRDASELAENFHNTWWGCGYWPEPPPTKRSFTT